MNEQLLKDIEAKSTRLETLLNAPERTEQESNEMSSLSKELKSLRQAVEAAGELESAKGILGGPGDSHVFENKGFDKETITLGKEGAANISAKSLGLTPEMYATIATKSYRDSFHEYVTKGEHRMSSDSLKVIREGSDANGGFLVPADYLNEIIAKKPASSSFLSKCRRLMTNRDSLSIPSLEWTTDDIRVSSIDATMTGEIPSSSTVHAWTDPTWAQKRIDIFTYMVSGQVSKDLIEDAAVDIQAEITRQVGTAYRLKQLQKGTVGTGIGEPLGIIAAPDSTVAGQLQVSSYSLGNPFTADKINALPWLIPDQYDDGAELLWMFRKESTGRIIRKLLDGSNRPIWSMGWQDNGLAGLPAIPAQLAGYPFIFNAYMPDAANTSDAYTANAFPIIFGDLTGYGYVERVGFTLQVLYETKAKDNQIELVGRGRFGCGTLEPWKLKAGKVA